jgi:T4 bacteriophage base plate protein
MKFIDEDDDKPLKKKGPEPKIEISEHSDESPKDERAGNYLPILEGLPSEYKFYPKSKKIFARPLSVSEVKLLASMNEENYDYVINDILAKTTKGIPVEDILKADKYFLLMWLRANSYRHPGFKLDFKCQNKNCGKNSHYNFDIEVLDVIPCQPDFNEPMEVHLPQVGNVLSLKYLRIKDEKKMNDFLKAVKAGSKVYDVEFLEIAAYIETVDGSAKTLKERYEFVENMTPVDFAYLLSYIDSKTFGISNTISAVCGHCREVTPVEIRFRPEFFIPKYKF